MESRTHEIYMKHIDDVIKDRKVVKGIKGYCCLRFLKYYKPTVSTCIDYMHSVLEGVMKTLFRYWFEGDCTKPYSLRKYMQEIDNRLLSIRPPSFVTTTPRSIYSYTYWHAHEFLFFLIYYALPVFHRIIPYNMYTNLTKLVIFIENLLLPKIAKSDLKILQAIIIEFLKELPLIYNSAIMLSGFHELVHLIECTEQFGPLNLVNCFQFEELNRKFMQLIHGKDLIGEEFIKVFTAAQSLSVLTAFQPTNIDLSEFIKSNLDFKTSNKKNLFTNQQTIKILSNSVLNSASFFLQTYSKYFQEEVTAIKSFTKINFKGHIYHSYKEYQRKHNDACVISHDGKIGLIDCFFEKNSKMFLLAKTIFCAYNPFFCSSYPSKKSLTSICHISEEYFIENIENVNKLVLLQTNNTIDCFISTFRCSHLFI